jgi:Cyclin, N-terminal domain
LRFDVRATKDTPRFLEGETTTGSLQRQPYITATMRATLVSWIVEVGVEYDLSDQAFHLAITLLDVMLAKGPTDLDAYEEQCRRRRLPRPAHSGNDDDNSNGSDDSTEPDCFVVQRSAFQAFGWYVHCSL